MTSLDWVLDGTLALALPIVAWKVVRAPSLAVAVVLFVALGLLSAFAWTRLGAVDVALVEASIGTGLSGALFMTALSWAVPRGRRRPEPGTRAAWLPFVTLGLACGLAPAIASVPPTSTGLRQAVDARLDASGVEQPVTAVLMSFRGYDTLLETIVLVVASAATLALHVRRPRPSGGSELLATLAGVILPVAILLSGYLVWRGSHGPGGAFQAGAVLAGGGVVLLLARRIRAPAMSRPFMRALLLTGPAAFVAVAAAPLAVGRPLLSYPPGRAGLVIVALETALAIAIALVLAMFYPAPAADGRSGRPHRTRGLR